MNHKNLKTFFFLFALLTSWIAAPAQVKQTFTNPLLPYGADPFCLFKDGYYYYTHTTGDRLELWKTTQIFRLSEAQRKVVYRPPTGKEWSKQLWAPEIHFIKGKWYIYFSADDGDNNHHRIFVLENKSADPMTGQWLFKGKVADKADKWAIDASVVEFRKKLYMVWSGWKGDTNGQQDIYIARMKNPWTIKGPRVRISSPIYEWERNGDLGDEPYHVSVNEGPQPLVHKKNLFVVYSASGCWTDHYSLGLLRFRGKKNLLDSASWEKSPVPVFSQLPDSAVYAPGHNCFFKSPDGQEDWILYHANSLPGQGCGNKRSPRAQQFFWKIDGSPDFGKPVKTGTVLSAPSSSRLANNKRTESPIPDNY